MNGKLRKLVQTNMVLYILLLLVFAGLTARLSPLLAAGEVAAAPAGVVCEPAAQQGHAAAASPVCGAHLRRRRHRQDQQIMLFAPMPMMVFNPDSEDVLWAQRPVCGAAGVWERTSMSPGCGMW